MDINNIIAETLDKYFNILNNTGYVKYDNIKRLISLIGILMILDDFGEFIEDEDIVAISRFIHCLSGDCFIDFIDTGKYSDMYYEILSYISCRETENEVLRLQENNFIKSI